MDRSLYEILEVDRDATTEQIRKAYKKKALQTHPDRLPPGASAADKANSEEQFRLVNGAYEILINDTNRRMYDVHGVWPPPDVREVPNRNPDDRRFRPSANHHFEHFHEPFFEPFGFSQGPFGRDHPRTHFVFTDPFTLFDSIFGDMHRHRFRHHHHHHHHDDLHRHHDPFMHFPDGERRFRDTQDFMDGQWPVHRTHFFPSQMLPSIFHGPPASVVQSESMNFSQGNGHWTQESRMTSTVNGVTQSIWKRTDFEGNEHVTRTYPDGREIYTINGIEQDTHAPRSDRYLTSGHGFHHNRRQHPSHFGRPPSPQRSSMSSPSSYSPPRGQPPHSYESNPVTPPPTPGATDSPSKRRWWRSPW